MLTLIGFFLMPGSYDYPLAAIINKMNMLRTAPSPKIVIAGGSEVLVGVDSEMIRTAFGYPVVNMGLYAGFHLNDVLPLMEPSIGPGDIVVLIPEYFVLKNPSHSDQFSLKWFLLLSPLYAVKDLYYPLGMLTSIPGDIADMFMVKLAGMNYQLWRGGNVFQNGVINYDRLCSASGDLLINWPNLPKEQLGGVGTILAEGPVPPAAFERMNQFHERVSQRQARVFMALSSYPQGEYELNRRSIDALVSESREALRFPILGEPRDSLFPYDHFSNTVNHLRFEARTLRTARMIELLRKAGVTPLPARQ